MPNHYDTLKIAQDAPDYVIKAAYRALSQKYHPDKNPSAEAAEQMRAINAAYEVLSNPTARARYDRTLAEAAAAAEAETWHAPPHHAPQDDRRDAADGAVDDTADSETPNSTHNAWQTPPRKPRRYGVWLKRLIVLAAIILLPWWGYTQFVDRDSKQRFFTIAPSDRTTMPEPNTTPVTPRVLGGEAQTPATDEGISDQNSANTNNGWPNTDEPQTDALGQAQSNETPTDAPSADGWMPVESVRSASEANDRTSRPDPRSHQIDRPSQTTEPRFRSNNSENASSRLRVVHRVQPIYPRRALQRRTEGYVTLQANVLANGRVADVRVANSRPKRVFDRAAINALKQWRFDNTTGRTQSTTQTIRFSLD